MKKYVQLLFIFLLINSNKLISSEKFDLISFEDVNIIFSTNLKSWNQNIIFLDKKETMEKIQDKNIDSYTLKTYFDYGHVLITPNFKNNDVEILKVVYNFQKNINIDLISDHFRSFQNYCSNFNAKNNILTIYIQKC